MSLFDSASLVVTPNGYKAGKLYSIKPTSGAGDLDVVRATSATRVNEQGLIEIPRTNLLLRSEEFDNATWNKTASTVTANATTSPSGTMTADKLIEVNGGSIPRLVYLFNAIVGQNYTLSFYLKSAERNQVRVVFEGNAGLSAYFNSNTGIVSVVGVNTTASMFLLNNGWYRCVITIPAGATSSSFYIATAENDNPIASGDNTKGIFLWGAQLEVGNVATEYIPTTSVIRTRFAGITQDGGSANNIPRLDYTNASCPSILVEPQRTNLLLRSEEFDNVIWTKTAGVVVTSNSEISPSGTMTADTINFGASNRIVAQATTLATGVIATGSVYIKGISGQTIQLAVGGVDVLFTLNGNWQKLEATRTSVTSVFNLNTFGGATARIISVWGAQLEVGSNATSYIPTQASTVTRNADVISKSGISSLIGQTEGTLFVDSVLLPSPTVALQIYSINDGSSNNRLRVITGSSQTLRFIFQLNGNVIQYDFTDSIAYTVPTRLKIAIAYKSGDIAIYVNGSLRNSSTNVLNISNALNNFVLGDGTGALSKSINSALIFPTRLSNAELAQLTTL